MSVPTIPARFPDPPAPPTAQKTVTRWDLFLGDLASGVTVPDAMLKRYMKRADIETMIRKNKLEKQRYQEAKLAGLRSAYSEFDLDEFFNRVAMGTTVGESFQEVFGKPVSATFYEILRGDPDLEERYQNALKTKATLEMEKVLDIIDDKSADTLPGPKGGEVPNMAAVQRARLQFEGRHKLAGSWYRRLYGEKEQKQEVNVNINLAERLERAIGNARDRKITPRQMEQAIDATYVEATPQDTSWMEDKPTDPIWREES